MVIVGEAMPPCVVRFLDQEASPSSAMAMDPVWSPAVPDDEALRPEADGVDAMSLLDGSTDKDVSFDASLDDL